MTTHSIRTLVCILSMTLLTGRLFGQSSSAEVKGSAAAESAATESFFFLSSNRSITNLRQFDYEALHNWQFKVPLDLASDEAHIRMWDALVTSDSTFNARRYVLLGLDTRAHLDLTSRDDWGLEHPRDGSSYFTVSARSSNAHCSFIYRLDRSDRVSSLQDNDVCYRLEYLVWFKHFPDSVRINGAEGEAISFSTFEQDLSHPPPYEKQSILHFPSVFGRVPQAYAVHQTTIELPSVNPEQQRDTVVRLECRLRRVAPAGIYIRGLRIQSDLLYRLARHDTSEFNSLTSLIDQADNRITLPTHKPPLNNFRFWAIVDRECRRQAGKTRSTYLGTWADNDLFRAVYEDENGIDPAMLKRE